MRVASTNTAGHAGINACGEHVRPIGQSSEKQESSGIGRVECPRDGVEYRVLEPRYHKARYKVTSIPEGMTRAEAASVIDFRAGMFGCSWDGDVLEVWTD